MPREMSDGVLTHSGWPRPIVDGLPVPWVSPADDLSSMNFARSAACASGAVCAVCGEGYQDGDEVYALVKSEHVPDNLNETAVQAMDNGIMHRRCVLLALKSCPKLLQLRTAGDLQIVRSRAHICRVVPVEGALRAHIDGGDYEMVDPNDV